MSQRAGLHRGRLVLLVYGEFFIRLGPRISALTFLYCADVRGTVERRELLRRLGAATATKFLHSSTNLGFLGLDSEARLVRLDRNESAYGPCEKAKAAFYEAISQANRYPDTDERDLRAAVARLHAIQPENITLGCGSNELLRTAAEVWLGKGKSLVMASPTYDSIAHAAVLVGAEVRAVPLNRYRSHDLEGMLGKIDATTGL